jgi:hypothetical protein
MDFNLRYRCLPGQLFYSPPVGIKPAEASEESAPVWGMAGKSTS